MWNKTVPTSPNPTAAGPAPCATPPCPDDQLNLRSVSLCGPDKAKSPEDLLRELSLTTAENVERLHQGKPEAYVPIM